MSNIVGVSLEARREAPYRRVEYSVQYSTEPHYVSNEKALLLVHHLLARVKLSTTITSN